MALDGPTDQQIGSTSFISLVPCLIVGKYTGNVFGKYQNTAHLLHLRYSECLEEVEKRTKTLTSSRKQLTPWPLLKSTVAKNCCIRREPTYSDAIKKLM